VGSEAGPMLAYIHTWALRRWLLPCSELRKRRYAFARHQSSSFLAQNKGYSFLEEAIGLSVDDMLCHAS